MCEAEVMLFEAEEALKRQERLISSFLEKMNALADEGALPDSLSEIRLEMALG